MCIVIWLFVKCVAFLTSRLRTSMLNPRAYRYFHNSTGSVLLIKKNQQTNEIDTELKKLLGNARVVNEPERNAEPKAEDSLDWQSPGGSPQRGTLRLQQQGPWQCQPIIRSHAWLARPASRDEDHVTASQRILELSTAFSSHCSLYTLYVTLACHVTLLF